MTRVTVADLFCGGGGTSEGLTRACSRFGRNLDLIAVNHWQLAIETHAKNHPDARHVRAALEGLNPRDLVPSRRLNLLGSYLYGIGRFRGLNGRTRPTGKGGPVRDHCDAGDSKRRSGVLPIRSASKAMVRVLRTAISPPVTAVASCRKPHAKKVTGCLIVPCL